MAYQPNLPAGQGTNSSSAPVVISSDQEAILEVMATALQALAAVKGILSDLRVSVVNTPATTATVTISANQDLRTVATVTTVTGLTNVGGYAAAAAPQNWQNQTAVQAFVNNMQRP
jgi:hypothetical protein